MLSKVLEWLQPTCSVVVSWAIDLGGDPDGRGSSSSARHVDDSSGTVIAESSDASSSGIVSAATSRIPVEDLGPGVDPEVILTVARASELTATEVACRLARGSRCIAVLVNGQVATTCWVSERGEWLGELEGWFVPDASEAYVWDCTTRSVFRGNHLYPYLLRQTLQRLSSNGIRGVWIATEWSNWRSARGVTRAGFRPVGAVVCIRLGRLRWQWVVADPGAPTDQVNALRAGLTRSAPTRR